MDKARQRAMAETFLARHGSPPILLLPNVWDGMSARIFGAAGFEALATTSGGVAWSLGYPDGEAAPWPEVLAATARIVRSAQKPVTADIEAGYADSLDELADHVAEVVRAGVVGVNLEDGIGGGLRRLDAAAARIATAREAANKGGVPLVINARCDVFHASGGASESRFAEAVERCKVYLAAGADCVYPFGLREPSLIAAFVRAIEAPVNITGRAGLATAASFEKLGVARISIASAPALVAMSRIQKLAEDLRATAAFDCLASPMRHPDAQSLFS